MGSPSRSRRGAAVMGIALASSLVMAGCTSPASTAGSSANASSSAGSPSAVTSAPAPSRSAPAATTPGTWPQFTDKDTQVTFRLPSTPEGYTFSAFPGTDFRQAGATYQVVYPTADQSTTVDLTVTVYRVTGHRCLDGRTELQSLQHGWIEDGFKSVSLSHVRARRSGGLSLTTGLILRDDLVLNHWSETFLVHLDKGGVGVLVGGGAQTTESGWTADQLAAIQQLVSDTVEQVGFPATVAKGSCGSFAQGSSAGGAST